MANRWSEPLKKSYVIADNKLALNAWWDFELLAVEPDDLRGFDFDLMPGGFFGRRALGTAGRKD